MTESDSGVIARVTKALGKAKPMDADPVTGTDILRRALRARNQRDAIIARMARDFDVAVYLLESFMDGTGRLRPDVMTLLAKEMFGGNVRYDATRDILVRDRPPEQVLAPAGYRPITEGMTLPSFTAGPPPLFESAAPAPRKPPKPGWAD